MSVLTCAHQLYADDDSSDDSDDEIQLDGALPKRRGANLGANSEDDKNDDDDEEEEGQDREIVDINLDFCDPNERFFHGIRYTSLTSGVYIRWEGSVSIVLKSVRTSSTVARVLITVLRLFSIFFSRQLGFQEVVLCLFCPDQTRWSQEW